jgi:hypothetical protein
LRVQARRDGFLADSFLGRAFISLWREAISRTDGPKAKAGGRAQDCAARFVARSELVAVQYDGAAAKKAKPR